LAQATYANARTNLGYASVNSPINGVVGTNAIEKRNIRINQLVALRKSVEYSQELLRNGFANYTEVINARQFLLQVEIASINDRLQQLQATVNLYSSLGGGWM